MVTRDMLSIAATEAGYDVASVAGTDATNWTAYTAAGVTNDLATAYLRNLSGDDIDGIYAKAQAKTAAAANSLAVRSNYALLALVAAFADMVNEVVTTGKLDTKQWTARLANQVTVQQQIGG